MANDEKKRRANWTREEEVILVEEVNKRETLLFGKLDGCERTNKKKISAWEEISSIVNSNSNTDVRTIIEMKKKYQNIKQKAKAKRSSIVRPPTGGGPRPVSPSTPEQLVLQNLEGRPSLCGIAGGIDTDISMAMIPPGSSTCPEENHDPTILFPTIDSSILDFSFVTENKPKSKPSTTEDLVLKEELEKVKEHRVLIQEQIKLAKLQQQLVLIQIENEKKSTL